MADKERFRLVTRSDFDGLVCAVLLKELDLLEDILFAHPKDMQDGRIEITGKDIITNLPYVPHCHLAFDHHVSETLRLEGERPGNHVIDPEAPSAARVVFNYFGGNSTFSRIAPDMMDAVDRSDSAQFAQDEILDPHGWVLLNFLMDSRTGLGRFRDFRISNYQLMMELIDCCREHTVEEILQLPDVLERVELYRAHQREAKQQIRRCARVHGSLVVLDLRGEEIIHPTNRFMIYALYPDCNISAHVLWGRQRRNTVIALGNSILNRTSEINVGALALKYEGGGHANAGTFQVENDRADAVLAELIEFITYPTSSPAT